MEYIWPFVVIAFGIISAVLNKGKPKSNETPRNMPTFGGGGERSLQPRPSQDNDVPNERTAMDNRTQQDVYTQRNMQPTLPTYESDDRNVMNIPDYDVSGEGVSQMYEESMQSRNDDMQKDIDRVTAALDKISAPTSTEWNAYDNSDEESRRSYDSGISRQVANGMMWSEILGPPRAKRSYNNRKS